MKHEHVCIYVMMVETKLSPMQSQSCLHLKVKVKVKGVELVSIMKEKGVTSIGFYTF
jgi:hypothetical protein